MECKDSTTKYTLKEVTTKKFGSKTTFKLFLINFTKS